MMRNRSLLAKVTGQLLSSWQAGGFFLAAMGLYSLPLILNNYAYIDDTTRGLTAHTYWTQEGRAVGDVLMYALSMTGAAPDLFPLTLFAGIVAMAYGMVRLARHWFGHPTMAQCAILLPLWFNPYYLQQLSYHYDCFTVSVGISLMMLAVSFRHRVGLLHWIVPSLLVAAGMGTNQITLHVFLGLACVDVLQRSHARPGQACSWQLVRHHFKVVLSACLLYLLVFYPMIGNDRGGFILPSVADLGARLVAILERTLSFISVSTAPIFIGLAALASTGWVLSVRQGIRANASVRDKTLYLFIHMLCLMGLVLAVPGMLLFISDLENNLGARVLIGVSPLLVGLFYLAYIALVRLRLALAGLLFIPLFVFLSFSYAYGQVMRDKKDLEIFSRVSVATDLLSRPELQPAKVVFIENYNTAPPISKCLQDVLPALDYVFGNYYWLLPEQLAKWGFDGQASPERISFDDEPVVVKPFYRIYLHDGNAYVRLEPLKSAPALECGTQ
ncbi:glucosyltransferase domain-containing protein [Pseudomonas massiliensis]|uniref:glucosyltransferase domain-containing protein n=1 Tax=Pseudomonas massiliensis TaxID=522492 RepID=UPI00058C1DAF|nr:glucosyltransferase domain-containing protein [Pseudomonas massiliensis]